MDRCCTALPRAGGGRLPRRSCTRFFQSVNFRLMSPFTHHERAFRALTKMCILCTLVNPSNTLSMPKVSSSSSISPWDLRMASSWVNGSNLHQKIEDLSARSYSTEHKNITIHRFGWNHTYTSIPTYTSMWVRPHEHSEKDNKINTSVRVFRV